MQDNPQYPGLELPPVEAARPATLRYSWLVVLVAGLGFVTSLAIHIIAYFQYIDLDMFLLYCRLEWVGVAVVGLLLGFLMPSTRPRKQLMTLLRWMLLACCLMGSYFVYCGGLYLTSDHPRKRLHDYVVVHGAEVVRKIDRAEYHRLANKEHRFYIMYLNRAFSLMWVTMFFGTSLYGIRYLYDLRQQGLHDLSPDKYVPWWYGGS